MPALEQLAQNKTFGGSITKYKFTSSSLGGLSTQLNIFLPASPSPAPALFYLAGLTCTEDTAPWKSGILRAAAAHNLAVIFPDTSPRGAGAPGEDDSWDFGTGAGFYLDATADGFKEHYNMESLVTREIPAVLKEAGLPIDWSKLSITGHSMGGHGALTLYLKNRPSGLFRAASAFAPICNPTESAWGQKAFGGYLSTSDRSAWAKHDALALLPETDNGDVKLKLTYGTADQFYKDGQLRPEAFEDRARALGLGPDQVDVERAEGYDHSYYFVSSFVDAHVAFHAAILNA